MWLSGRGLSLSFSLHDIVTQWMIWSYDLLGEWQAEPVLFVCVYMAALNISLSYVIIRQRFISVLFIAWHCHSMNDMIIRFVRRMTGRTCPLRVRLYGSTKHIFIVCSYQAEVSISWFSLSIHVGVLAGSLCLFLWASAHLSLTYMMRHHF